MSHADGTCLIDHAKEIHRTCNVPGTGSSHLELPVRALRERQRATKVRGRATKARRRAPRSRGRASRSRQRAPSSRLWAPRSRTRAPNSRPWAPRSRERAPNPRPWAPMWPEGPPAHNRATERERGYREESQAGVGQERPSRSCCICRSQVAPQFRAKGSQNATVASSRGPVYARSRRQ